MGIRQFKPITKGTRFRSVSDFSEITRSTPEKSLVEPIKKSGGRDNHGHISMRRRGGGHKRMYRKVDFRRERFGVVATVREIEYDPNRSARIALVEYADGELAVVGDAEFQREFVRSAVPQPLAAGETDPRD
jgi:large subunit ribosomal protein L2